MLLSLEPMPKLVGIGERINKTNQTWMIWKTWPKVSRGRPPDWRERMALINCPDCGRTISNKAPQCLDCGCPIAEKQTISENIETEPEQLTPEEVARRFGGTKHLWHQRAREGKLAYYWVGKRRMFRVEDIREYLDTSRRVEARR